MRDYKGATAKERSGMHSIAADRADQAESRCQQLEVALGSAVDGVDRILNWLLDEANQEYRHRAMEATERLLEELQQSYIILVGGKNEAKRDD